MVDGWAGGGYVLGGSLEQSQGRVVVDGHVRLCTAAHVKQTEVVVRRAVVQRRGGLCASKAV